MTKMVNHLENILLIVCVGQKMETRCQKGPPCFIAGRRRSVLPCLWLFFFVYILKGLGIVSPCNTGTVLSIHCKTYFCAAGTVFFLSESSLSLNAVLCNHGSVIGV